MVTFVDLASRGYFPIELPPPFNTRSYGALMGSAPPPPIFNADIASRPVTHNLKREGLLRRQLSIPNPVNFYQLAPLVAANWNDLSQRCNASTVSISKPISAPSGRRAIDVMGGLAKLPVHRASIRSTSKYILKTDIESFYQSIYTHSIPWAIHTKSVAKAHRHSSNLVGNQLDKFIRNAQDRQTLGIPISPDTSALIAEIILAATDQKLASQLSGSALRYVDDYEIGFASYSQAEAGLALLQTVLGEYELSINPRKTSIIELPVPLDSPWASELRTFSFRPKAQLNDLIHYFGRTFELARSVPHENVLKYSIARMNSITVETQNWETYQDILCQCAMVEPETLSYVVDQFLRYAKASYAVNKSKLQKVVNRVISTCGPLDQGSVVAWALWACILFDISIDLEVAKVLSSMEDPVVALLTLHADSKCLLPHSSDFSRWQALLNQSELYGNQWLLAYEANVKGWLPLSPSNDYVSPDQCFSYLKANNVEFYDSTAHLTQLPRHPISTTSEESFIPSVIEDLTGYLIEV